MLLCEDGYALWCLHELGINTAELRDTVHETIGKGNAAYSGHSYLMPRVKKVMELSREFLSIEHGSQITSGHLLAALLHEGENEAARILVKASGEPDLRDKVLEWLTENESKEHPQSNPARARVTTAVTVAVPKIKPYRTNCAILTFTDSSERDEFLRTWQPS